MTTSSLSLRALGLGSAILASSVAVEAQCLDWATGFDGAGVTGAPATGIFGEVDASVVFDDGNGPALYIGGSFVRAGARAVSHIARWNGSSWSDVGGGISGGDTFGSSDYTRITSLAVFDDGGGPELYAGGDFTIAGGQRVEHIAKWDGVSWSDVGFSGNHPEPDSSTTPLHIDDMIAFDDGSGPALYVGGNLRLWDGQNNTYGIARWNGNAWTPVGSGISAHALAVFDDGSGPMLHASGFAKWNGSAWIPLQPFSGANIRDMAVFDAGTGPALYLIGGFNPQVGPSLQGVLRWDGSNLMTVTSGSGHNVLAVLDDGFGGGEQLYVGGRFDTIGGVPAHNVARWNGSTWSALASGVGESAGTYVGRVETIASFGGAVHVGGSFGSAAALAVNGIARWNGGSWSALGDGNGIGGYVMSLAVHDDGSGRALFALGGFSTAGNVVAHDVAKWNGTTWSPLPSPLPNGFRRVLLTYDDGTGAALYAAGTLTGFGSSTPLLARWNGSSWSTLASISIGNATVRSAVVFKRPGDANASLFVGGNFATVYGWNGTSLSTAGVTNGGVTAMAVYDDGSGPQLVIGGPFTQVDGVPAAGVARWNGATWSAIGAGLGLPVAALEVFQDGSPGPAALYAAVGDETGSVPTSLRRWSGSAWSNVGNAPPNSVLHDLAVVGDGTPAGAALYVAGEFTSIGGVPAHNLARWDGSAWSEVVGGIDGEVMTIYAFNDGTDAMPDLFIGGLFNSAGGVAARKIAKLHGCEGVGEPFCFADGAIHCPCASPSLVPIPQGAVFAGCATSFNPHGASLTGTGTTNPDTVTLHASGMSPVGFTMFLRGDATIPGGLASFDGVRCTGGALIRFGAQNAVNGRAVYPNPPLGHTLPLHTISGITLGSGVTNYYQPFYRNVTPGFCSPGTINFTNGYAVKWN